MSVPDDPQAFAARVRTEQVDLASSFMVYAREEVDGREKEHASCKLWRTNFQIGGSWFQPSSLKSSQTDSCSEMGSGTVDCLSGRWFARWCNCPQEL